MKVDGKQLGQALGAVVKSVSTRPGIPALTGVRITSTGGQCELAGTDLETTVRVRIPAAGDLAATLVPARLLAATVKGAKGEVEIVARDGHVDVTFPGGATATLRALPVEDFPTLGGPAVFPASLDAAEMARLIREVAPAASRDEARPLLTGALLVLKAGALEMAATDSYRLHVAAARATGPEGTAIVPARALEAVGTFLGTKASGYVAIGQVEGSVGFSLVHRSGFPVTLTSRVIEGEFPNYGGLIPDVADAEGILTYSDALVEAITGARAYCRDSSPVRLELKGSVKVSASSPDLGGYSTEVGGWDGPELVVAFNPEYLLGVLAAAPGASYIRDELKPLLAIGPDGTKALVMPVKLPAPIN